MGEAVSAWGMGMNRRTRRRRRRTRSRHVVVVFFSSGSSGCSGVCRDKIEEGIERQKSSREELFFLLSKFRHHRGRSHERVRERERGKSRERSGGSSLLTCWHGSAAHILI